MIFRSVFPRGLACLFLILVAAGAASAAPLRVLLLTGNSDEQYHSWRDINGSIRDLLGRTGRFDVRVNEDPRGLTAAALTGYDAVLISYHGPRWPRPAETAIENFVRAGGGLIAFHYCTYGPFFGMQWRDNKWHEGPAGSGWAEFPKMIGASWEAAKIGHARRWMFTVDWKDRAHPVAQGLPASFVANDELYHRLNFAPTAKVLADALSPKEIGGTGAREPLIWTHEYGKGRVFYTVLGHDTMAWYQPGMMNAFARGVEWAASGAVTLPVIETHHRASNEKTIRVLAVTSGHSYPTGFYSMLDSLPNVAWTHAASHAEAFSKPLEERFDVVLLHDSHETTTEQTRERLKAFVEAGKGIVSVHHAIVDYTDWPWWYEEVIGGKYFVKPAAGRTAAKYHEDLEYLVTPVKGKERHPVLRGVGPLWLFDEVYKGQWISPKVEVLMETDHPENDKPMVYIGPHPKARVIFVQPGHSDHTMKHPGFRRLMANAVAWAAGRE